MKQTKIASVTVEAIKIDVVPFFPFGLLDF